MYTLAAPESKLLPASTAIWAPALNSRPRPSLRVFCFPYAGGGLPVFRAWPGAFSASTEIRVMQYPGRGARLREKRFEDLNRLADTLACALEPLLDVPFAIFGHSLGALLAFETARRLSSKGFFPRRLFVSGNNAPQIPRYHRVIHTLPDDALLEELKSLNGIQQAILDSEELIALLLPTIRSDFAMLETYVYDASPPPLECPITAFGGLQDPRASRDGLEGWQAQTADRFELNLFPGGHFFLETARPLLLQVIASRLIDNGCAKI